MHGQLENAIRLKAEVAQPDSSLRVPPLPLPPSQRPEPEPERPKVRQEPRLPGYDPELVGEAIAFTED